MNGDVRARTRVMQDQFAARVLQRLVYELKLDDLSAAEVEGVWREVQQGVGEGRAAIYAKVRVDDLRTSTQLAAAGWNLVDTNVQLEKIASLLYSPAASGVTFRFAESDDEEAVAAIARTSFPRSRWHQDVLIPHDLADSLKEEWARNFWRGARGDYMIVAESEGQVVGFHQVVRQDDETLLVDLLAVDERYRGRSIGTGLVLFATEECGSVGRLLVGTQLSNHASLAMYQRCGFRFLSARHVWHRHLLGEAAQDRLSTR